MVLSAALVTEAYSADVPPPRAPAFSSSAHESLPHRVSRREIYDAIQSDLAHRGITERAELRLEDLSVQASVPLHTNDPGLKVKRITYDPIRRETVFELRAAQEPEYLPFAVTTRRDPQVFGLAPAGGGMQAAGRGEASVDLRGFQPKPAPLKAPILAKPGTPAMLVMYGENARITATVIPLQPGIKGQRILVRDPVTSRVLAAEVAGVGLLQANF